MSDTEAKPGVHNYTWEGKVSTGKTHRLLVTTIITDSHAVNILVL